MSVLKFKRKTTAQANAYLGAEGELVYVTTDDTLRIYDGVTVGGFPVNYDSASIRSLATIAGVSNQVLYYTAPGVLATADVTSLVGLVTPLAVARGGTGKTTPILEVGLGYIEGLTPTWVSASSVSVSTGAAYIPGAGRVVTNSTTLTLSGLTLTANTWYYLYYYLNAGSPAIELVTTAPDVSYTGTAKTKTGDTSRRLIATLRSNTGTGLWNFKVASTGLIHYRETLNAGPFRCLTAGAAAVLTVVDLSAVVPPTTTTAQLLFFNNSSTATLSLTNADASSTAMILIGPSEAISAVFTTTAARTVSYLSNGGSAFIDVHAYGNDR